MTEPHSRRLPSAELAALPRVDAVVTAAGELIERHGRGPVTAAVREALDAARERLLATGGQVPDLHTVVTGITAALEGRSGPPREVINAAGVVVHTNLGRAPLSAPARQAVEAAAGYCDLEYDLERGQRGARDERLASLLAQACGAEVGIAVNNAAAALVLALAALARGRNVLVSRGELVEIGGSFRLPDIMAASGARLVEVGTTNRTRAADYEQGDDIALLLRVHPSNYRVTGFTQTPTVAELAAVARGRGVPLVHDVGSGLLADRPEPWLAGEPSVRASLDAGADLVLCSGDKLLGGPQAGLLVGRADLVQTCRAHPLARALRLDKLRIAALVATLSAHLRDDLCELPVWAALLADPEVLAQRCALLAQRTGGEVVEGVTMVGGGTAPGAELATPVVRVPVTSPDTVTARLREGDPPIVLRVEAGSLLVDLRTVPAVADELLARCIAAAVAAA
ncbi:MAG: L-seryl-tRNA(Sec) selenium transferase [Actinomycetota bacterium]|nr:L-seryl-tRNA(Sec) selenium transferase [Actinomycetota bacterium]